MEAKTETEQKVEEHCTCHMWVPPKDTRLVVFKNRRYHASCLKRERRLRGGDPIQQGFSLGGIVS